MAAYIARDPGHFGGLHSHRLAQRRRRAIGSIFIALHELMDVQFHCVIEKSSVEEEKISFSHTASPTQY